MDENKYFEEYESVSTNLSIRWKIGKITKFVGRKQGLFSRKYVIEKHLSFCSVYDITLK